MFVFMFMDVLMFMTACSFRGLMSLIVPALEKPSRCLGGALEVP